MKAGGDPPDDVPARSSIRVLTWNLWWRFGPWRDRAAAIRSVLLEARPDICGLQEVWGEIDENLAGRLAAELGVSWDWVASPRPERWRRRVRDPAASIGHAVLTRWPIVARAELSLPAGSDPDEGRVALLTVIQTPRGRIPFATTQLNSPPWQSATRCLQVRALVEFLAGFDRHDLPVVLAADMNAEPESDEVRLLEGHKTAPAVPGFVLVDAWRYADPGATPWTWDRTNPHVVDSMEPSSRIDYVFVGTPRNEGRGHVRSIRRIADRPVAGVWASDHAGLLAELGTAPPGDLPRRHSRPELEATRGGARP